MSEFIGRERGRERGRGGVRVVSQICYATVGGGVEMDRYRRFQGGKGV